MGKIYMTLEESKKIEQARVLINEVWFNVEGKVSIEIMATLEALDNVKEVDYEESKRALTKMKDLEAQDED